MKCPKCGYNSFEFLDQCKKCSNDLVLFKESNGIRSVLMPVLERGDGVSAAGITSSGLQPDQAVGQHDDETFSWDEPVAEITPAPAGDKAGSADFLFGETATGNEASLDDLLETSATLERATVADGADQNKAPANGPAAGFETSAGEFEMADFFSEDKQEKKADTIPQQGKPAQDGLDGDFDFLFSSDENEKK
ncbi:hypothetical protein [Geotalea toluenoxydans]|uniref:hypothetical protein n=1 Tax=Geotalea toluenoxydans TaxID=421624 RepID=UPI0006D1B9FE|nr:hypothetical protein [Geotalea toluenoxydans]